VGEGDTVVELSGSATNPRHTVTDDVEEGAVVLLPEKNT
jgi:hypothetical protein